MWRISAREATQAEICTAHTASHYEWVRELSTKTSSELRTYDSRNGPRTEMPICWQPRYRLILQLAEQSKRARICSRKCQERHCRHHTTGTMQSKMNRMGLIYKMFPSPPKSERHITPSSARESLFVDMGCASRQRNPKRCSTKTPVFVYIPTSTFIKAVSLTLASQTRMASQTAELIK